LPCLFAAMRSFAATASFQVQFVLVDDGSKDATCQLFAQAVEPGGSLAGMDAKLVKLARNRGFHTAMQAGITQANAPCCMIYQADMPEPIADIALFYQALQEGFGIVYSRRAGYKGSLASRIFAKLVNKFIDPSYPSSGLFSIAFNQTIKDQLNQNLESSPSVFFQIFSMGFARKELLVDYQEREHGTTKWSLFAKLKLFADSFVMFSHMPIRFITGAGIVMAIVGFLSTIFTVVAELINPESFAAGWPTLLSILLIGFGITNLSLGIIAEYLVRTLDAARNRPTFVIEKVIVARNGETQ